MTLIGNTTRHVIAFAFLWWVLCGNEPASWAVGVPAIILATALSAAISPARPWRLRLHVVPAFAWFFLKESLRGGIDVARRVYSSRMPLQPALVHYPMQLPAGPARVLMLNILSLLPGTLSADIRENIITAHVVDISLPVERELRGLEEFIAALFAVALQPEPRHGHE